MPVGHATRRVPLANAALAVRESVLPVDWSPADVRRHAGGQLACCRRANFLLVCFLLIAGLHACKLSDQRPGRLARPVDAGAADAMVGSGY